MNIPKHTYHVLQHKESNAFWTEWLTKSFAFVYTYYAWFYLFPVIFNRTFPKVTTSSSLTVGIIILLLVLVLYKPLGRLFSTSSNMTLYSLTDSEGNKNYMLVKGKYIYGKATGTIYTTEEAKEMPLGEFLATYPEAYVNDEGEVDIK